ncbi:cysteine--tRNA ligase [Propionicicella superfundia]|uniref:cysteine--tRNA ligase n=1 Tax=Propionicicella superfundia TaxID=348582 RepID=UPI0004059F46|nr:cysteine--tRNA ligase [Propionicicella superfundia]
MTFHLYDSATRAVTEFVPTIPGKVSIYHCGMTVDGAPHLGHIRKEVVFDVLRRWLTSSGYEVTVVANVTDIDDKILAKSAARGVPWWAHAYHYERELHAAYAALGCTPPTYEPRATGHIPEMLALTQRLIERGHAYVAPDGSGDVYFDVLSWPDYGRLSGQKVGEMEPAADADPRGKRDPRDFALWKGSGPTDPPTASWPSPWGPGRPGWHLECSAMAGKYLGATFDIHGGGIDLRFPHHENELAQSTAAGYPFARYWMHNAWVTAAGEKMSKSLGNTARVTEVTKRFPARAVRLYLAAPHYRSAVELSDTSLAEATASLARIDSFLERAAEVAPSEPLPVPAAFAAAMDDDLATPAAMAVVYQRVRDGNVALETGDAEAVGAALGDVLGMLGVFGLDPADEVWASTTGAGADLKPVVDGLVASLLQQRQDARARKDYAAADAIRDQLGALGVKIEDTPSGARWSLSR